MSSSTASSVVGRQPERARRPGVLVGLGVGERRQQPHVELVADLVDRGLGHARRRRAGRCERQVRAVLLDGAERLHDDAALGPARGRRRAHGDGRAGGRRARHVGTVPGMAGGRSGREWTRMALRPGTDHDAIVVGAGHNGLVTAAYLARAGLRTLAARGPLDRRRHAPSARRSPGRMVNICNCDHVDVPHDAGDRTSSTSPPTGCATSTSTRPATAVAWTGGPAWTAVTTTSERTLDELAPTYPTEVDGYRRYLRAALPAVRADPRRRQRAAVSRRGSPGWRCADVWPGCRRCCAGAGAARPT